MKTDENPPAGCLGVRTGMSQGPTVTWHRRSCGPGQHGFMEHDDEHSSERVHDYRHLSTTTMAFMYRSARGLFRSRFSIPPPISPEATTPPPTVSRRFMNLIGFFVEGMCDVVYPVAATPARLYRHHSRGRQNESLKAAKELSRSGIWLCGFSDRGHVYQDHPSRRINCRRCHTCH